MRPVFKLITAVAVALGLSGQALAQSQEALEVTDIRYQGTVGQVVWIELAEHLGYLAPLKAKWVGNTISGPQDVQAVVTNDIDIGGAFNGALVKLIAKRLGVTDQDVVDMNRRLGGDASLNAPIREDGDSGEWQDWLADDSESQETVMAAHEELDNRRKAAF